MKVVSVIWRRYEVPFRRPYVTARGSASQRRGVLVRVQLEDGVSGWGEAALLPEDNGSQALAAALADVASMVAGEDAEQVLAGFAASAPLPAGLGLGLNSGHGSTAVSAQPIAASKAARNAIECAILDAQAKQNGVPLYRLLAPDSSPGAPGCEGPCVAVNALVTEAEPAAAARAAAHAVADGYKFVKLKVGMFASLQAERERIAAVRSAVGPGVALRLDANGAWSEEQAVALIRACQPLQIEYVEQPVAPGDPASLARVQRAVDTPIAADEEVTSLDAALALIEARAVQVLVVKPQVVGGLAAARRIYTAAQAAGIHCVVTSSIETGIGVAAALHLAASMPGAPAAGLATLPMLAESLIEPPGLPVVRGSMAVPSAPGLGVRCTLAMGDRSE